jgi:hypothetical protein
MKRFLLLLPVLLIAACAHVPDHPPPDMPQFVTKVAKNCAVKCQQMHTECKSSARECNQELDQCYQLCKELLDE